MVDGRDAVGLATRAGLQTDPQVRGGHVVDGRNLHDEGGRCTPPLPAKIANPTATAAKVAQQAATVSQDGPLCRPRRISNIPPRRCQRAPPGGHRAVWQQQASGATGAACGRPSSGSVGSRGALGPAWPLPPRPHSDELVLTCGSPRGASHHDTGCSAKVRRSDRRKATARLESFHHGRRRPQTRCDPMASSSPPPAVPLWRVRLRSWPLQRRSGS